MEKTSIYIAPNKESNLHNKKHNNVAKSPNNRKTKNPQAHYHPPPPHPNINPQEWIKISDISQNRK